VRELIINGHRIADDTDAYVIAEIGHNHGGSYETAKKLIQMSAAAGASACKLQKRENDTLYSSAMLDAPYEHEHSYGKTYGEHRRALEFGAKEYLACRTMAGVCRVDFFATAFDEPSVDFLMIVDVPAIKLASGSLTDFALLKHAASYGKPLILSTGGGTYAQVDAAVETLLAGKSPFALLHCTAAYPVQNYGELNLLAIAEMRARYPDTIIGWSGHDPGISMALVAYAYGARIIEKHVTLNRAGKGTDHAFSLEPKGLQTLCEDLKRAHLASGDGMKRMYESERGPLSKMRRMETPFGRKVTGQLYDAH
jgi:sialic acid synthase